MGCTGSKNKDSIQTGRSKSRAGLNPVQNPPELSVDELHKMKENALQRHDTEIDILSQIAEERRALKAVSTVCIARKQSCEDLLESLSLAELALVHDQKYRRNLQKQFHSDRVKQFLVERRKEWVLYNNLEAVGEEHLSILCNFFVELMHILGLRNPDLAPGVEHIVANLNGHDPFAKLEGKQKDAVISVVCRGLKKMKVVLVAPVTYYQLKPENLYEYELPPGLITINEAMVVIELYRRGGKLVTSSVHKLLRLGYLLLSQRKNVCEVTIDETERLILVGDIHGQLADLLHILDFNGMPGNNGTKYIFNGDFVDRGDYGVECMLILLALLIARPDCVYMNRGNHEDFAICSVYGFQAECCDKYDPITFSLFVEIFQQLPFYCVVNENVFVVHGGLFHAPDITLADLDALDRANFTLDETAAANGDDFDSIPRSQYNDFLHQMGRDSLWSDPLDLPGRHPSQRGAGISFGPDVAREFLQRNNLQFIVRSHECIRSGYDEPYITSVQYQENATDGTNHDDNHPILCTIFSASDYGGSGNSAAYLEMRLRRRKTLISGEKNSKLALSHFSNNEIDNDSTYEKEDIGAASPLPPVLLRHPSITNAVEAMFHGQQSAEAAGDNTSELKFIANTSLYYTVHYFFATPLRFDELASQFANSNNSNKNISHFDLQQTVSASTTQAVPFSATEQSSSTLKLNNSSVESFANSVQSMMETTVSAPANAENSSHSLNSLTEANNNQSTTNLLIGWGKTLEELICERKQFLYEAFTHADRDGHGHVHMQQWLKVMSDSFNISLSWKKFAFYLITPKAREYCELSNLEAVDPLKFLDSFHDDIARKLLGTNDDDLVTDMDQLHSFIESFHSAPSQPSQQTAPAAVEKPEIGTNLESDAKNVDEIETVLSPSHVDVSLSKNNIHDSSSFLMGSSNKNVGKLYFGHEIYEEVIDAIYSNRKYLEAAFVFFDTNKDGLFTIHGFQRGLKELNFDLNAVFPGLTPEKLLEILDIYECGEVDMNVFYEMYRLCCLNRLYKEDGSAKPLLRRETTVAAEIHRLSVSGSSAAKMVANHVMQSSNNGHLPVQNSLATVEIKRGRELAVDAELASRIENDLSDGVGLPIDI